MWDCEGHVFGTGGMVVNNGPWTEGSSPGFAFLARTRVSILLSFPSVASEEALHSSDGDTSESAPQSLVPCVEQWLSASPAPPYTDHGAAKIRTFVSLCRTPYHASL
jgi:hypothetical protein